MGRLDETVAIVTGGARGVGRGEALLLASEGAAVVVNDLGGEWDGTGRDERPAQLVVDEITAAGGTAAASYDDVADWTGGQRLVDQAVETFGRLDILVCNAGILRDRVIFNLGESDWDDVIRVHLKGHFVPSHFATRYWRARSKSTGESCGGRIVFTASEAGLYGNSGQANYAAAKAGIASLGVVVAREMARYGVTCNTICPRARTRLTEGTFGAGAFAIGEGQFDAWHPDNVAPMVAFLCSDDAPHITGQTFCVGGGTVELMQGWQTVHRVGRDHRWTVDELANAQIDLFVGRSTEPAPFPLPDFPGGGT